MADSEPERSHARNDDAEDGIDPGGQAETARSESQPDQGDSVRDAIERSRSGAPAVGSVVRDRFSSDEVFQRIIAAADEEVTSGSRELFFSGLAAGFAISITVLLYASLYDATDHHPILSALLYPLGFIYIIIGGYQLYTENTLPPVALTLERLASLPALLRHWTIVLAGNFAGGAIGAAVLLWGNVLEDGAHDAAIYLGTHGIEDTAWLDLFFKAAFAGLIVAGVVWIVFASRDTISRIVIVYMAFLSIPIGNLFHVVTSFTEMSYVVFAGEADLFVGLTQFVLPVLLGNTIGGILLVTVVNYYQTSEERLESARFEGIERRLSLQEWTLGSLAGRSYVPIIDTAETAEPDDDAYRVVVPIANPRTESRLVEFATTLARDHESAIVHIVHIVQTPDRPSAIGDERQRERIVAESENLLEDLGDSIVTDGVDCETSTVITHRSFEEIFDTAAREHADLVVMGWGESMLWDAARAERPLGELTTQLPCDFLVMKDRGLDTSRILLPTAGGPDSDLSASVARTLSATAGAEVSLLHVVDDPDEREEGERFLAEWAADRDLNDAELIVETGEVEDAICRAAGDHTLILMGATERGLLSRLVTSTLHLDVVNDVDSSVLLAERPTERSLYKRIFGRR